MLGSVLCHQHEHLTEYVEAYTPKHVFHSPVISFGSITCSCCSDANFATGYKVSTPTNRSSRYPTHLRRIHIRMNRLRTRNPRAAPTQHNQHQPISQTAGQNKTHCAIVCNIIVASDTPSPAPPSASGSAMPIQPSAANAACSSCGYSPDSSRAAQYS